MRAVIRRSWSPLCTLTPTSGAIRRQREAPTDPERKDTVTQLAQYYRDRAPEYDAVYAKPERQDDLVRLHDLVPRLVTGHRVLEIAAGTGYWTAALSTSASAITATDINQETLQVARTREYGRAPVTFQVADAYALDQVPGQFDTAFVGFFWSHIPRADLPRFLDGLRARLSEGTGGSPEDHRRVIVLDNRYVPGSSTPIIRSAVDGDTFQRRTLNDGRCYEIVKNFPSRGQFTADLAGIAAQVEWTELSYYWLATCTLR
jgi:SAM-dependent methyltransferase